MGLLTLLPILGLAAFFARILGTTMALAMLHAVSATIIILYVGGLAQALWWTALAIHVVGVGLLGHTLWMLSRDHALPQISTPIAILLVCATLFWLVHGNSLYLYYDEYAHWGIYLKEMLALDGFWFADTNSMHPRYPPAAPLWQYLFNVFREPHEGTAYLAQFVLLLTPLLVLWERTSWRQAHWPLLILALCLLALTNFGLGVSSLYVDHVIGAWFVGTILCFVIDAPTSRRIIVYALPLTALALIKESSVAFSLAAAGILGSLLWLRLWKASGRVVLPALRGLFVIIAVTLPALLCLQVWEWHLDRIGAPADLEAVARVVTGLAGGSEQANRERDAEITRRFVEVFSGQQLSNDAVSRQFNAFTYSIRDLFTDRYRLTTLGLFVTFSIWWIALVVFVLRGFERWKWGAVAAGVAFTGAAYIAALYFTYRSAGEYGLLLSSYMRYVHTVALPMLIVSFAPLLPAFRSEQEQSWRIAGRSLQVRLILALVACIGLYVFETPYLRPVLEKNAGIPLRHELEPITASIRSAVGRSSVWLYLPNDLPNGFVGHLLQYLMAPTPTYVERDGSFLERSPEEAFAEWSRFDYVWLPTEIDPALANRFAEIAGMPLTDRLFTVSIDDSGKVRLKPAVR